MDAVYLTKDGRLLTSEGTLVDDALTVLSSSLSLKKDCTLRSFLAMLCRYPSMLKISRFLPGTVKDAESCPSSGCLCDDIRVLVVGKTMELIGFPGKPQAELYLWMRGLGPEMGEASSVGRDEDSGGVPFETLLQADRETRFIPLQMLLDTPLRLSGMKHVVLGDVDRNLFCNARFPLFEVIDGIAWELGFQSGAQQCSIGR